MTQLALIAPEPRLTDRQADALQHLKAAGADGLTGTQLGTLMGVGPTYAKANGLAWLRALKRKGLCEQKRGGVWRAIGDAQTKTPEDIPADFSAGETAVYNALPEDF